VGCGRVLAVPLLAAGEHGPRQQLARLRRRGALLA
jgi:hypothetical protein